jgi:DNA-binding CsgD family transcriptional regulator
VKRDWTSLLLPKANRQLDAPIDRLHKGVHSQDDIDTIWTGLCGLVASRASKYKKTAQDQFDYYSIGLLVLRRVIESHTGHANPNLIGRFLIQLRGKYHELAQRQTPKLKSEFKGAYVSPEPVVEPEQDMDCMVLINRHAKTGDERIILLGLAEGKSYTEISEEIGVSRATARNRTLRLLERIQHEERQDPTN